MAVDPDVPPLIERAVADAIDGHETNQPHLTADMVRSIIADTTPTQGITETKARAILDEAIETAMARHLVEQSHYRHEAIRAVVTEVLEDTATPPPPPPPPPAARFAKIPDERLILGIDPTRPETFNHTSIGQKWAAGNMIQPYETTDHVGRQLPPAARAGYGLVMDPDGNVHSWPMANERTHRYGAFTDDTGRWFTIASQFRTGDGYLPTENRWYSGGIEVPPNRGWRVNTGINRAPGQSDAVTFDSAKSGLSAIGADTPIGPNANIVHFGIRFRVAPWMHGSHSISGPISLHEPGHRFSSPVGALFNRGNLVFWAKHTPGPGGVRYDETHRMTDTLIYQLGLPAPGEVVELVVALRPDRTGANPFFGVYTVDLAGDLVTQHETDEPLGWTFAADQVDQFGVSLNNRFYPVHELHPWHEWNSPGSGRHPLWNSDQSTADGPCIYLDSNRFTVSDQVTSIEVAHDLAAFRPMGRQ